MDWLENLVAGLIEKYLVREEWGGWGTVVDYSPASHTAMVTLEPDGETVGPLPIGTPHTGLADTIPPGTSCYVAKRRKKPEVILCLAHNDKAPVPQAALSLTGDAHIQGSLTLYGGALTIGSVNQLPTPTMEMRGRFLLVSSSIDGLTGNPDTLYVCLQSSTGALNWKQVAQG